MRQSARPERLVPGAGRNQKLHYGFVIDPAVPRDEQFAAVRSLIDDGVIGHAGLSEVTVEEIEAARKVFPVATVQNQ